MTQSDVLNRSFIEPLITSSMNNRQIALFSGTSIVIMAIAAGVAMGLVFTPLFDMTLEQFKTQESISASLLVDGIIAWVIILICDVLASWGLYRFYAEKNRFKSMLMGSFRLVYSFILLLAIVQLIRAVMAWDEPDQAFALIRQFQFIWQFGLILFGVHLLYLSGLVCEKNIVLKVIAVLLLLAGVGYVASNIANLVVDNYAVYRPKVELPFIIPMIFGELGLAIWLMARGGKRASDQQKPTASVSD